MPQPPMHMLLGISSLFKSCLEEAAVHPSGTPQPRVSPSALALRHNSDYTSCSGYLRFGAVHGRKTPVAEAAAPRPTSGRAKSASFFMGGPYRFC